jgi:hypothetical protein
MVEESEISSFLIRVKFASHDYVFMSSSYIFNLHHATKVFLNDFKFHINISFFSGEKKGNRSPKWKVTR